MRQGLDSVVAHVELAVAATITGHAFPLALHPLAPGAYFVGQALQPPGPLPLELWFSLRPYFDRTLDVALVSATHVVAAILRPHLPYCLVGSRPTIVSIEA